MKPLPFSVYLMLFNITVCSTSTFFMSVPKAPEDETTSEMANYPHAEVDQAFREWTPESNQNVWELSGLFEGDIMIDKERNGLLKKNFRWPNGSIPFYIRKQDFSTAQVDIIKSAMQEFDKYTCIKFKPWTETDVNYLYIKGNDKGCYSYVGMNGNAQALNLNATGCVYKHVVLHEMLHSIGFHHQQSSSNRDGYIDILWENIKDENKHNFNNYNSTEITDFGQEYDFKSIMHYSNEAFTKQKGLKTMVAKNDSSMDFGNKNLSEIDIAKINLMYEDFCSPANSRKNNSMLNMDEVLNMMSNLV